MEDSGQQAAETRKVPTHEVTYLRLRDMVLFGVLAPGQPVTIQGLIRDLEAGMTPVREAIRRLTAEGALVLHDNRRVSVPRMTPALLDQLQAAEVWSIVRTEPLLSYQAFVLYYGFDKSVRQIAHTLSISEDAVKSRLYRTRERIRAEWKGADAT